MHACMHDAAAAPNQNFKIPIFKVKAVDTSGAGDAFDAGLLTGLIEGWTLDKAVMLGSAVAALKVMKIGTRTGLPRMEEALGFIEERTKKGLRSLHAPKRYQFLKT